MRYDIHTLKTSRKLLLIVQLLRNYICIHMFRSYCASYEIAICVSLESSLFIVLLCLHSEVVFKSIVYYCGYISRFFCT